MSLYGFCSMRLACGASNGAVARDEQAVDVFVTELLTRGRLPSSAANPIKAKQAEFLCQTRDNHRRLGHGVDVAHRKPVPGSPRGVGVLVDTVRIDLDT